MWFFYFLPLQYGNLYFIVDGLKEFIHTEGRRITVTEISSFGITYITSLIDESMAANCNIACRVVASTISTCNTCKVSLF